MLGGGAVAHFAIDTRLAKLQVVGLEAAALHVT